MVTMICAQTPLDKFTKWRSPDGRNIDVIYVNRTGNVPQIPNSKTIGSPYVDEEFKPSSLYNDDASFTISMFARYNVMDNVIEIKNALADNDSLIKLLNKTPDLYVKIDTHVFDFVPFSGKTEDGVYFEVLFRGNAIDLYKKHTKKFIQGKIARSSFEVDFPERFIDENNYFFVTKEGNLIELPDTHNKIRNAIPYKNPVLDKYIKQNKLELKEEKDLIKMMTFLDSLL